MDSRHFRLKIGQFLFASYNRIGFRLTKSKHLDETISNDNIMYLCSRAGQRDKQTFLHAFLPNEKLLTITCITPAHDSSGRQTSHNHTFIIRTTDLEEALKPLLTEPIPINPPKEMREINVKLEIEQ